MNARERFQRTMHFQPVDRPPLMELGLWPQTTDRWRSEGMPPGIPERGDVLIFGSEFFGLDRLECVDIELNIIPEFPEEILEEDERYLILRRRDGRITKALKEGMVRGVRMSMDQYLDFPVQCRQDWEALKWRFNPASPARFPPYWEDVVRCLKGRDYPLHLPAPGSTKLNGFFMTLRNWMGTEKACTIFYDDPVWAHEMCDFIADMIITTLGRAVEDIDFDYFFWAEDFAYNAGPLVSPHLFEEFLVPRYRRVNDFMRSHGIDVIFLDSDGDMRLLIPMMIDAGINGVTPCEVPAHMNVVELRKGHGHDLLLMGGIDKRVLAQDKQAIRAELLAKIPPLLESGGGYVPMIDHSAPPDVPYENFLYYLDLKRKIVEGKFGA
jgi:uroporphyrinogen decarboxylase